MSVSGDAQQPRTPVLVDGGEGASARSRRRTAAGRVALVLCAATVASVLASCGSAASSDGAASPTDDGSFGVDGAEWPDSMVGARELLADLPEDLDGAARDDLALEEEFEEEFAFVSFGDGSTSVMASDGDFDGIPAQDTDAQGKLAAMFGLGYGCDMDTYEGTIEPVGIGPGPAAVDGAVAWFTCRIDGVEGDEGFTGTALGWTSTTEVAWLVVGPDEAAVRTVVASMHEALG